MGLFRLSRVETGSREVIGYVAADSERAATCGYQRRRRGPSGDYWYPYVDAERVKKGDKDLANAVWAARAPRCCKCAE